MWWKKTAPWPPFSAIEIGGVLNVYLEQGDTEALTVEADENLLDIIETENRGKTLVIRLKKGVELKKAKQKNVYVTLKVNWCARHRWRG